MRAAHLGGGEAGGPDRGLRGALSHLEPSPGREQVGPSSPTPVGRPTLAPVRWPRQRGLRQHLCCLMECKAQGAPAPPPRCCCSSDSCCEEWDSRLEKKKKKMVFFFCINGNKIQEKLPPTPSLTHYLCFSFLVTVFVFGPGDGPADSPGSNPGGVCITPFYLYKKNDG